MFIYNIPTNWYVNTKPYNYGSSCPLEMKKLFYYLGTKSICSLMYNTFVDICIH